MQARLAAWRTSSGARLNEPNPDYDPALAAPIYRDFDSSAVRPLATAAETAEIFREWRALMNAALTRTKPK
jgi:hypothetical protein